MTWIIAHRGASADERENTLPAFERAIAVGADFVELDVQVSADGALVAADDVTRGKPDPEGYVRALAALGDGLVPPDVVAFEDTEAGVAAARAAGLRCLAVRGTHADERLAGADGIVDAIDVDLVRSLVG